MTAGRLAWYAVNSLFAPRAAARQLMGETDAVGTSWKLIALGAAAVFLSSMVINSVFFAYWPESVPSDFNLVFEGYAGIAFDAFLFAAIAVPLALVSVFIWKHMFGYKMPALGAFAAGALSVAINVLISPVLDVLYGFSNTWSFAAQMWVFAATALTLVLLPSFYYSEIFNIGFLRSVFLNVAALLLMIVPLMLLGILIAAAYLGADAFISGAVS
jgi:hypothetical protein